MCNTDIKMKNAPTPKYNNITKQTKYMPLTKRDTTFIDIAYNTSMQSKMLMKHGACVVENNTVIGTGCNSSRNRFKNKFIGVSCSCHAEMNALYNALKHKNAHQRSSFSVPRKKKSQRVLCSKGNS
jgi:deoxycytidylate deaminase